MSSREPSSLVGPALMTRCTVSGDTVLSSVVDREVGFIARATVSEMVEILADEMTRPVFQVITILCRKYEGR